MDGAGGDSIVKTVEEIKAAIEAAVPGAGVTVVHNGSPSGQHSLRIEPEHAVEVATFLRDDAELALDFLSNVTGVDFLDKEISEKIKVTRPVTKTVDGLEQTVEETVEETRKHVEPGYLEAVYQLFSVAKKHGPSCFECGPGTAPTKLNCLRSRRSGDQRSFRSARSSTSTALSSRGTLICGGF